jgi:uncharacterized protein (DUF4415 family)
MDGWWWWFLQSQAHELFGLFRFVKLYPMNENVMNSTSKTDWEKIDALTEDEIDTSDIPPLTEEFFSQSRWWKPVTSLNVLVPLDASTLAWFQAQGEDSENRMTAALQIYAAAHKAAPGAGPDPVAIGTGL